MTEATSQRTWRQALGFAPESNPDIDFVERQCRGLTQEHNAGGNVERLADLAWAIAEARKELRPQTTRPRMWPIYVMAFFFMGFPTYIMWDNREHPKPVAPKEVLERCVMQCVRDAP